MPAFFRKRNKEYPIHPANRILPPLSDEDYLRLEHSVREQGVRQPVRMTENNHIVDGRYRQMAALATGQPLPVWEHPVPSGQELTQVIHHNAHRMVTDDQKAVAAQFLTWGGGDIGTGDKLTYPEAANIFQISEQSVEKARKVRQYGVTKVFDALQAGTMTLDEAYNQTKARWSSNDKSSDRHGGFRTNQRKQNLYTGM